MGSAGDARAVQLAELRRRMAAVPARGVEVVERPPTSAELRRELLPIPPALAGLLPEGGMPKGAVVAYSGAGSLLTGLLAAVTGGGGYAAAVGLPRLGLLAAAEMGADLGRLAVVTEPGPDPVEVAAVLLDGLDLVVVGLAGMSVPPSRTRILAARARSKGATLVVTGGAWSGPTLRIDTRVAGYSGLGRGRGRLRSVRLNVCVRGRSAPERTGTLDLCPRDGRVEWLVPESDSPPTALSAVGA
ncbi:hypothetical protein C5E45_18085 [Nocardia nova]|uniref:Uncharacterized protein n=1 Tax=Nocardia nova TaxID=37330 RepID=A0A2S6ANM1_9NOCA|nr:hypothetical protein [Nocardia nova]PPJ23360.1 hypothetical protein C5E41_24955 [Nocardia nova]PPJ36871.1 hypothetical protein C5E45_18085 [Nocardia nova]